MSKKPPTLGPYSRLLRRGAIGKLCDGRSELGRFIRHLEAELVAHCGGNPSITQRLLINRVIKSQIQLDLLDDKITTRNGTDLDTKIYSGLQSALRNGVRELGWKPARPDAGALLDAHLAKLAALSDKGAAA